MPRWVVGAVVVGTVAAECFSSVHQVGYSFVSKNGETFVSAGTSPTLVGLAILGVILYTVLMLQRDDVDICDPAALWRRGAAFAVDFYFGLLVTSSLGALLPVTAEAARTGHFAWQFERNYATSHDAWFGFPFVLIAMVLFFLYFALPLTRGRQTVGCYLMGTKVTPPFGDEGAFTLRQAVIRTFYEFVGLCGWFSGRLKNDAEGRNWVDRRTGCRVVRVRSR